MRWIHPAWLNPTTVRMALMVVALVSALATGSPALADGDWGGGP